MTGVSGRVARADGGGGPGWQVALADTGYWQRNIPCQDACPVHTDARGYVRAIADGDYALAYLIARGPNPLASMCGRVCGAHCERRCRRGNLDRPIAIRALKRFAMEHGGAALGIGTELPVSSLSLLDRSGECQGVDDIRHLLSRLQGLPSARPDGERVAIIGSGPAGLACAHDLCLMGFRPVIFEMEPVPAGMMYVGVPEYRLPRDVIESEVALIKAIGTEIRCDVEVGRDILLPDILDEFAATVVAVGAKKSRKLPIPGVEGAGVLGGVEFLRDVAYDRGPALTGDVVVIGGGNVAYDAARTTVRQAYIDVSRTLRRQQPISNVYLVCLESLAEMPADDVEIIEGQEEGVIRRDGWGPTRIERDEAGQVRSIAFQRCLRAYDEAGRFAPEFAPEQTMTIDCTAVILTVGQAVELPFVDSARDGIELTERGMIKVDSETLAASRPGVFVAGDAVTGAGLMIDAIASGKRAARSVFRHLRGTDPDHRLTDFHQRLQDYSREAGFEGVRRVSMPVLPADERRRSQKAVVECGFNEQQAEREASRCLDCGVNTIFDGRKCILCGGCVDVCPTFCLKLVPAADLVGGQVAAAAAATADAAAWREGSAIIKDEDRCIRCANCEKRCPTGAITMERFCYQESAL